MINSVGFSLAIFGKKAEMEAYIEKMYGNRAEKTIPACIADRMGNPARTASPKGAVSGSYCLFFGIFGIYALGIYN